MARKGPSWKKLSRAKGSSGRPSGIRKPVKVAPKISSRRRAQTKQTRSTTSRESHVRLSFRRGRSIAHPVRCSRSSFQPTSVAPSFSPPRPASQKCQSPPLRATYPRASSSPAYQAPKRRAGRGRKYGKRNAVAAGSSTQPEEVSSDPLQQGASVDFSQVGGLKDNISTLKEMILLPLQYPELFNKFKPPRGVLFYGPPGTGKTLVARALATELSRGRHEVTFITRNGPDVLAVWLGESEKNLRQVFEEAKKRQPAVIFFDELDALAPTRSSRQDHVYTTLVGTLLSLMDGLSDRERVLVIGATNRPDAIDPALRRPGRFDRELFFSPPDLKGRQDILRINMEMFGGGEDDTKLVRWLAESTVGFCGADLSLLVREASLIALRQANPAMYDTDDGGPSNGRQPTNKQVKVTKSHYEQALKSLSPAAKRCHAEWRETVPEFLKPLTRQQVENIIPVLKDKCPWLFSSAKRRSALSAQYRLLVCPKTHDVRSEYLSKALLSSLCDTSIFTLDHERLISQNPQEALRTLRERLHDISRHKSATVLYLPNIRLLDETLNESLCVTLQSVLDSLPQWAPLAILATADVTYARLPKHLQQLFSSRDTVYVSHPEKKDRDEFFEQILSDETRDVKAATKNWAVSELVDLTRGWDHDSLGHLSVKISQLMADRSLHFTDIIQDIQDDIIDGHRRKAKKTKLGASK